MIFDLTPIYEARKTDKYRNAAEVYRCLQENAKYKLEPDRKSVV